MFPKKVLGETPPAEWTIFSSLAHQPSLKKRLAAALRDRNDLVKDNERTGNNSGQ
jgi:hypothetical protein